MSFTQGLSGLSAASSDLEVIGNNVANANTVGFKSSQAQFGDLFAAALSGAESSQIGIGTKLETVAQQFTQGNITTTGNTLDIAINGPGFFNLNTGFGAAYSRNGQFQLNKDGYIVSSAGYKLQGYVIDPTTGKPTGSPTSLQIPTAVDSAVATGASTGVGTPGITVGMNLDSSALPPMLSSDAAGNPSTNAFNPTNPDSYNNSTSITTYDSFGNAQNTTMYFVKDSTFLPANIAAPTTTATTMQNSTIAGITQTTVSCDPTLSGNLSVGQAVQGNGFPSGTTITALFPPGGPYTSFTTSNANPTAPTAPAAGTAVDVTVDMPNNWLVYTTVTNPTTGAAIFPTPAPAAGQWSPTGLLTFNTSGTNPVFNAYSNATAIPSDPPSTASPLPPAAPTSIQFAPNGTSGNIETIPFHFDASTQFGVPFGVTKLSQDGYTAGQLSGFTIGSDGTITGNYSNGVTKPLGQLALTTFANMQGLQPLGNNTWAQTQASGSPVTNAPGSGLNGTLQTGATEGSNTNLTDELVNMMTAQRNYQANAQTIKTQDTILQTLINLR